MARRRGHGEGSIHQRDSDGRWCSSVDLGFLNGRRKRKVIYGKTRKDVADKPDVTSLQPTTALDDGGHRLHRRPAMGARPGPCWRRGCMATCTATSASTWPASPRLRN